MKSLAITVLILSLIGSVVVGGTNIPTVFAGVLIFLVAFDILYSIGHILGFLDDLRSFLKIPAKSENEIPESTTNIYDYTNHTYDLTVTYDEARY